MRAVGSRNSMPKVASDVSPHEHNPGGFGRRIPLSLDDEHMCMALETLGKKQFSQATMRTCVPKDVCERFDSSVQNESDLLDEDKDVIAHEMCKWAMAHGAAQYSHMFYPLRSAGLGVLGSSCGLKYDAFVDVNLKDTDIIKSLTTGFSASKLFVGETDGSSFPNGGMRSTHRAGAWTAWDRTSPPCVVGETLYIPCALISQTEHALDEKTPLLRANDAINREGMRLLRLLPGFNPSVKRVISNVGPEQEFFIISRKMYLKRPDLLACGRTVLGAPPPKCQEESLNYFSALQPRVSMFFRDLHQECWKLGISNTVMHNEVAPAQCEVCHIFTLTNVAADWNMMMMDVMNRVAIHHDLVVLLHEKPFASMNGSGKHNNWGLFTDVGDILFTPGETKENQQRFMAFVACLMYAVHEHSDVLRNGIATASNDHRLGGHEAPPAIISIHTGEVMEDHIDAIISGGPLEGYIYQTSKLDAGCSQVAPFEARFEDRNRTGPLPFCGNRFEFRAVGSAQNIAWPLCCLNTAMADGMRKLANFIEAGGSVRDSVSALMKEARRSVFSGNNYSEEWRREALSVRKLLNLKTAVDATDVLASAKNITLFSSLKVLAQEELVARQEIAYEAYANIIHVEAKVMISMLDTGIIPACAQDLKLYDGAAAMLAGARFVKYKQLVDALGDFKRVMRKFETHHNAKDRARFCLKVVKPGMDCMREIHDEIEGLVQKKLYPYPSYQEILFHHHSDMA